MSGKLPVERAKQNGFIVLVTILNFVPFCYFLFYTFINQFLDFCSLSNIGYSFVLRSPNQRANQIRRSYKNEEFDWLFDFVTVT